MSSKLFFRTTHIFYPSSLSIRHFKRHSHSSLAFLKFSTSLVYFPFTGSFGSLYTELQRYLYFQLLLKQSTHNTGSKINTILVLSTSQALYKALRCSQKSGLTLIFWGSITSHTKGFNKAQWNHD